MRLSNVIVLAACSALLAAPALADESKIKLKEGPGRDKVEANCVACHSLDYIQMNSVFLDRKVWSQASIHETDEVLRRATGGPLDPKHFEAHLRRRYLEDPR